MRPVIAAASMSLALAGCAVVPIPLGSSRQETVTTTAVPGDATVPPGMQYLYVSGEAAAAQRQTWATFTAFVARAVRDRPRDSVVLGEDATLAAPRFEPCGAKPLAVVVDVDETVLLNRGFEYDAARGQPYSPSRWQAYERTGGATTVAVPGAGAALADVRRLGVTVVFNTNRSAANAAATEAALDRAGLGPAVRKRTLWLQGDDNTGSLKDARRWRIADGYCVVAMAGDQLGDFTDLFNQGQTPVARRAAAEAPAIVRLWGAGWFVLPNPVYGTALKGEVDDVFPAGARWSPPQENR